MKEGGRWRGHGSSGSTQRLNPSPRTLSCGASHISTNMFTHTLEFSAPPITPCQSWPQGRSFLHSLKSHLLPSTSGNDRACNIHKSSSVSICTPYGLQCEAIHCLSRQGEWRAVSRTRKALLWLWLLYRLPPWTRSVSTSLTQMANNEGLSLLFATQISAGCTCQKTKEWCAAVWTQWPPWLVQLRRLCCLGV